MPTWMQGFCLGAALVTVAYLLLSVWAALSLSRDNPYSNEDETE